MGPAELVMVFLGQLSFLLVWDGRHSAYVMIEAGWMVIL